MGLDGMTQLEIEALFSQKSMIKQMEEELKEFMVNINKEHYIMLHKALDGGLDKRFTVQVMVELIAKLGNPKIGINTADGRIVEINHMIALIAGLKSIVTRYDTEYRFKIACDIIEEMDTVLFDVYQKRRLDSEYGWITETNVLVQFNVGDEALKLEGLNRYKFPLIEAPIDWTTEAKGGYHDPEQRLNVTTNRGSNKQPQQVLDVINILQGNKYKLRDIDLNEEHEYAKDKMIAKATNQRQLDDVELNVTTRLMTCWETYNAMNEREFYFTWNLDCRGRMYSNGYDINLQADKFKKGIVKPVMLSSKLRAELEAELNQLEGL